MKKLLLVLTAVAVALAFAGLAMAKDAKPAAKAPISCVPMKCENVPPKVVPWKGKWAQPKIVPFKGPSCGPCISLPGDCYANVPQLKNAKVPFEVDVMRDLCKGDSKGKCNLCGPCSPEVKWAVQWKTSVICGKIKTYVVLPPAAQFDNAKVGPDFKATRIDTKVSPCPPPDCPF
jgi:hypothetical protein